jgi:hypothetical protein
MGDAPPGGVSMTKQPASALTLRGSAPARRAVRRTTFVLSLVVAALAWAAPATAASPEHFSRLIDERSFSYDCPAGELDVTVNGFYDVTLFHDASGAVTRYVEKAHIHAAFSSPDTGNRVSFVRAITDTIDYAAGTAVGAPATVTVTGSFFQHVPGAGTDGGRRVLEGTVVGEEDGIPLVDVDFEDPYPLFAAGRHPSFPPDLCDLVS